MDNPLHKRIEVAANVAIIVVALLLGVVLIKRFVLNSTPPGREAALNTIKTGAKISLPDTDWSQSERHLVLVLQKGCHFCAESAPFYRRLVQALGGRNDVRLIAALPQEVGESRQYLDGLGVAVSDVRQTDPSTVGVRGTPTLLLVDRTGTVTDVWVGKLPPEKEQEVFSRLQVKL
jgi:thioredoxin-related protein